MLHNRTLDVISLNVVPLNDHKKISRSCTIYIVLFAIFFIISIPISSVFIYSYWYLKKDNISAKFNPGIQTTIH